MKHLLITITSLLATTAFADPIHDAAWDGDLAGVQSELGKGMDVNAKNDLYGTPLLDAVANGHKEIVELLIAEGADVGAKNRFGETPLYYAAGEGRKELVELLIANGADVNVTNGWGKTPLHRAAERGRKGVVELLITAGADLHAKTLPSVFDEEGKTPLHLAVDGGHTEIADLLRKHQLMPRLVQHSRFAFSFDAKEGKVYEVQDSFDLLNWEPIRTYTGAGDTVRFDEDRDHDPPQWFYRVKMVE